MQNEIIDIQFLRSLAPFTNRDTAISKLQSLTWSVGKPAVATYKVGSETRGLLAIGIADGVGKCRILADDEDFQTLKVYTEALNKKVDDYIEVTDTWKEVVDSWRSVTDDRLVELEGKSHVQNTDTGTTSPTFQVDSTSNGPKLKGKGGDLELRNAGDTDYAGLTLGDITIKGNVTQEGDTFISKAETVEINDNLLLINKGEVGAGVTKGIAGIEIDRGTLPNYQIIFDESDKRFKAGEVGNIWPLALRDEEVNMVDGMFVTWDSTTKRLKTTNTVPSNRKLFFTDSNSYLQLVSHDFSGSELAQTLAYTNARGSLFVSAGTSCLNLDTDKTSFRFYKNIVVPSSIEADTDMVFKRNGTTKLTLKDTVAQFTVPVTATTFNRASDGSEVLYHADIVDDLVTGGTGKVLSAEQGKLLSSKVNEIGDTYLPLSAGSGKHVTGDLYLDQKIYMKNLKPIYVQDSKGNNMQVLQGATLDGEEVIQLGASSKIRVESVTDFSKAVKFKDTVVLGADSKLYYEVSSSSSRIILDPAGGNIVLGNVNVQDMKFSTAVGKDLYHLEGTTPYKIWTAHSFDPDSKANRINPVVEQTLTLNTSTTGYKVKLGADDTGYPGMFVSTQAGVSKSSLYYSPKSDAWEIFTGAQSGVIATQNWVINQVPTIFYARGFEVRKYNAAVNLDSDLLYGGAAVNYSDLTYWTNAPEGFSYGTVYQLGLQNYTNLNAQLAFDIIHTSDTDQKTNHLWFRTSGKAGYGVAGWKRVVTADELEGYVPSGDLSNYYTKTQSDARYWTKTELVDPATKSGNNTFTGTNSFTAGKFNVGPLEVLSTGTLLVNITSPAGSGWSRSVIFEANSDNTSKSIFGGCSTVGATNTGWAYIGIGDVNFSTAQYKFRPASLTVPIAWLLDDPNGNALVWSQSSTLVHLGRALGTTKIRSGAVDLIHTKGSTDYKILDESNWESIIPNAKWTYGFVSHAVGNDGYDANSMIGADKPKLLFNYYTPGKIVNAPTGMSYGNVLQIDGPYTSSYNEAALKTQLAFDIIHNVDNGTGRMWYRTANNKGMAVANWRRVLTAEENIAGLSFDENNYPAIIRVDGTTYPWLRANGNGFLPNVGKSLASGGASQLGTSGWSFREGYIATVHTNKISFGTNGAFIDNQSGDSSHIGIGFYTSQNASCPIYASSLCVSSGYANDAPKIPINGIYSKGQVRTNASMMVGQSSNVTFGQLGYGINYGNSLADGVGSEYSTGATLLFHFINPNQGNIGYIAPTSFRAGNFIPTYLKLFSGKAILGVGKNIDYNAGDSVTVTEYTLLHQGNSFYLGVPTTYVPVRMPEDKAALASGNGYLEWWNSGAGWVNHRAGKYIVNGGSSSQFLKGDGSLDSTAYLPLTGGTVTGQVIFNSYGLAFQNNAWSNDLVPNRTYSGYLQVLDAYNAANTGGPTNYGTVLQVNSRNAHWANQLWFSSLGLYHRHMAYNQTEYSDWTKLATASDLGNYLPLSGGTLTGQVTIKQGVDIKLRLQSTDADNYCIIQAINAQASQLGVLGYAGDKWAIGHGGNYYEIWDKYNLSDPLKKSEAVTLYYPYNGRGYLTINSSGRPIMSNNQGYAVTDKDGNAREVLWMGTDNVLKIGNTSLYTLNQLDLRCTTLTHNGNSIATQNYVTNQLANYLPLTGGALSGALTINAVGSTPLIVNNSDTNGVDSILNFKVKGVNKTLVGYSNGNGPFIQDATNNRCIMVKSDGAYFGTGLGAGTRLATLSDIPDVSGFVKSTSTRKVKDIQIVDTLPTTQASGVLYLVVK